MRSCCASLLGFSLVLLRVPDLGRRVLHLLGLDKLLELEREKEELKRKLFVRFSNEHIEEMKRELMVNTEEELLEVLTFDDLVDFARKYHVPWLDLKQRLLELEKRIY
jgi:hypothetical protein